MARPERVAAGHWLGLDGNELTSLPDWDYTTAVVARRELDIDVAGLRADCGLDEAALAVVVLWRSTRTGLHGAIAGGDVDEGRSTSLLEVDLEGLELGGTLHLTTRIVLGTAIAPRPLTAHLPGTILWQDHSRIALEGAAARFPMETVDFQAARLPAAAAAWYLDWPREHLEEPTLGAMRLFLNSRHPTVSALISGSLETEAAAAVVSTMRFDVARTLVVGALEDEEFRDGPDYPEGSVGASMRRLLRVHWPGETTTSLYAQLRSRPDAFFSSLQERLRFLVPEY
jgi:hypothetical protein